MSLARSAALAESFGVAPRPESLTGRIAAVFAHDNDADRYRALIGLLQVIDREAPRDAGGPIADAIFRLKEQLYEIEPVPRVEHVHEWMRDHKTPRVVRCQCGCEVDRWESRTRRCEFHQPRPMGSLPARVEDAMGWDRSAGLRWTGD